MNKQWNLHFKITNWCNLHCAHCCEYSTPKQPLNLMPMEKIEKYLCESVNMEIPPHELITIGGGEAMAPYMHGDTDYIPYALDLTFEHGFVPTLKTNGTWGDNDALRAKVLSGIANCAYKSGKLVTLDISVDEFHNNHSCIIKIIKHVLNDSYLCPAIRFCLVGFNTKKSKFALDKIKQDLSRAGFQIFTTPIGDWEIYAKDGTGTYLINSFDGGIFNLGRAKENRTFTTIHNPNNYIGMDCLQIDNNDNAILNYTYREKIQNRNINEVLSSLRQHARGY